MILILQSTLKIQQRKLSTSYSLLTALVGPPENPYRVLAAQRRAKRFRAKDSLTTFETLCITTDSLTRLLSKL